MGERILVRNTAAVQWIDRVRIEPVLAVVAFGSGQREFVTQTEIHRQARCRFPVVLGEPCVLVVLHGRAELDFIAAVSAPFHLAHQEAGHSIATIGRGVSIRGLGAASVVEGEVTQGGIGLDVVDLAQTAVKAKLHLVWAAHFAECKR